MGELLHFPSPSERDGGKARIRRRRKALALDAGNTAHSTDDLVMAHADPEMPCDSNPHNLA